MHFKPLKTFFNKPKDRKGTKKELDEKLDEIVDWLNKPDKLKNAESAPGIDIVLKAGDIPVRPHGPASELAVAPEDKASPIPASEVETAPIAGEIKIAEVSTVKIAAPEATLNATAPGAAVSAPVIAIELKKEEKKDEADSLNKLFATDEEEENPLASLINSLPDVTVQELMDDLNEIHKIIKEWKHTTK